MEWSLFGSWQILLCTPTVQKHDSPLIKTEYLQPRSFMEALPRIPFLFTIVHFLKSGKVKQKLSGKPWQHRSPPQLTTIHMLTPLQKLKLAPMLLSNILKPSCGTFMALQQTYHLIEGTNYIETFSGCMSQKSLIFMSQSTSVCTSTIMQFTDASLTTPHRTVIIAN